MRESLLVVLCMPFSFGRVESLLHRTSTMMTPDSLKFPKQDRKNCMMLRQLGASCSFCLGSNAKHLHYEREL